MEAYTGFASVYDLFMDNIPYRAWCDYVTSLLKEYGVEDGLVLDLGCGTGKLTRLLAGEGYDMIGVDLSEEMLEVALEHEMEDPKQILYLQQDMREFELYGTVRAIVSICDSMNYLEDYEDLVQVLKLANNYLDPKGVFVFDMNTVYKYREQLGEQTIAENREESSFIWENYFDENEMVNEYDLTCSSGKRTAAILNMKRPITRRHLKSVKCWRLLKRPAWNWWRFTMRSPESR